MGSCIDWALATTNLVTGISHATTGTDYVSFAPHVAIHMTLECGVATFPRLVVPDKLPWEHPQPYEHQKTIEELQDALATTDNPDYAYQLWIEDFVRARGGGDRHLKQRSCFPRIVCTERASLNSTTTTTQPRHIRLAALHRLTGALGQLLHPQLPVRRRAARCILQHRDLAGHPFEAHLENDFGNMAETIISVQSQFEHLKLSHIAIARGQRAESWRQFQRDHHPVKALSLCAMEQAVPAVAGLKVAEGEWSLDPLVNLEEVHRHWDKYWASDPVDVTEHLRIFPAPPLLHDDALRDLPPLSLDMLQHQIKTLDVSKAGGADGLTAKELKTTDERGAVLLLALLRCLERLRRWPKVISVQRVVHLAKPGKQPAPDALRPICLLPFLYRIWAGQRTPYLREFFMKNVPI